MTDPEETSAADEDPWGIGARIDRLQEAVFVATALLEELKDEMASHPGSGPRGLSREFVSYLWDNGAHLTRAAERLAGHVHRELVRCQQADDDRPIL